MEFHIVTKGHYFGQSTEKRRKSLFLLFFYGGKIKVGKIIVKIEPSYAKLNLTLRVVGHRPNGFHELSTVFLKIGPVDYLTINKGMEDNVKVTFKRIKSIIQGRNILLKTLDRVRRYGIPVSPLEVIIEKSVPPGTGLGCGSGNAAALLNYLKEESASGFQLHEIAASIGADVPFFCTSSRIALAEGIGEKIQSLDDGQLNLFAVIVIPHFRCNTSIMYGKLDAQYGGTWPKDAESAREESREILRKLGENLPCGLLPNDFCAVLLKEHPEYDELFEVFRARGAIAWGISGSGSAAFGLWKKSDFCGFSADFPWIEDVQIF